MSAKACFGSNPVLPDGRRIPLSAAVRAGDFLFVSGQVPVGPDGRIVSSGFEDQVHQVMRNISRVLADAGCTLQDVVKCTVWLDDPRNFVAFNDVYRQYFPNDPPARSTVQSALMIDASIEIEAVAYKP
jgi:2-iminobutanoate/2-iminopropanoate deaminase